MIIAILTGLLFMCITAITGNKLINIKKITTEEQIKQESKNIIQEESNNKIPIDCKVTDWSGWSLCDKTCGIGKQYRTRDVLNKSKYGGVKCPQLKQIKVCKLDDC